MQERRTTAKKRTVWSRLHGERRVAYRVRRWHRVAEAALGLVKVLVVMVLALTAMWHVVFSEGHDLPQWFKKLLSLE